MLDSFLHERSDFKALVATVADSEKILDEENLSFDREGRSGKRWRSLPVEVATGRDYGPIDGLAGQVRQGIRFSF